MSNSAQLYKPAKNLGPFEGCGRPPLLARGCADMAKIRTYRLNSSKATSSIFCSRRDPNRCGWRTADVYQPLSVTLHAAVVSKHFHCRSKDLASGGVLWLDEAIVYPFAVPTALNQPCTFKISQMPRDLRIVCFKRVGKKARADLVVAHQVQ